MLILLILCSCCSGKARLWLTTAPNFPLAVMSKQSTSSRKLSLLQLGKKVSVLCFSLSLSLCQHMLPHGTESLKVKGWKARQQAWPCKPAQINQRQHSLLSVSWKEAWDESEECSLICRGRTRAWLYTVQSRYANSMTPPQAPLSPNEAETKETATARTWENWMLNTSTWQKAPAARKVIDLPEVRSRFDFALPFSCFLSLLSVCPFYASNKVQIPFTACRCTNRHTHTAEPQPRTQHSSWTVKITTNHTVLFR